MSHAELGVTMGSGAVKHGGRCKWEEHGRKGETDKGKSGEIKKAKKETKKEATGQRRQKKAGSCIRIVTFSQSGRMRFKSQTASACVECDRRQWRSQRQ